MWPAGRGSAGFFILEVEEVEEVKEKRTSNLEMLHFPPSNREAPGAFSFSTSSIFASGVYNPSTMDNKQIARVLRETAQLLEIDGAIIGRYRSYEKAAELIDGLPESIEQLVKEPGKLKELPGIGDRMVEHLQEIVKTGDYALRKKLLKKYPATILDLLQLQSLGPKKVAFLWSNFKAGTVAHVERIAKEGKLRDGPGFCAKS